MPSIGIPRALLFYEYYPLYRRFFEELGVQIVVSGKTNKSILDNGIKSCVDEACLPIKSFFGHVVDLRDKADYIFIPRLISVSKKEYICPKVAGLPDMVKSCIPELPPIIDTAINLHRSNNDIYNAIIDIGKYFTKNKKLIYIAYDKALQEYRKYMQIVSTGVLPSEIIEYTAIAAAGNFKKTGIRKRQNVNAPKVGLNIAIIGHSYNVYDDYINMGIIDKLKKMDVNITTIEMLPENDVNDKAGTLTKKMFWRFGTKAMGTSFYIIDKGNVDGIIFLMSFACGIDSFVCDLSERYIRRNGKIPFMVLMIDEHTGEAGINTRVEAFIDMIKWRKTDEGNVSTYGKLIYNSQGIIR